MWNSWNHSESIIKDFSGSARLQLNQRVKATGHKAVLSGEGADELMGGYAYFRLNRIRTNLLKGGEVAQQAQAAFEKFLVDEKKSEGL